MDHEIESFLVDRMTPESLDTLKSAARVIESFEVEDFEDVALLMLRGANAEGQDTLAPRISAEYRAALERILRVHSIVAGQDCGIEALSQLCRGLKAIDDYDDMDSIIDIIDGDENPRDRLAEIIAMASELTVEDVLMSVESVDESLLQSIRALRCQSPEEARTEDVGAYIQRLEKYKGLIAPIEPSFQLMIDSGMPLGLPFKTYKDFYLGQNAHHDLTQPTVLRLFVTDVIGLAIISRDAGADPMSTVRKVMTEVTSDLRVSINADTIAKTLAQKLTYEKN